MGRRGYPFSPPTARSAMRRAPRSCSRWTESSGEHNARRDYDPGIRRTRHRRAHPWPRRLACLFRPGDSQRRAGRAGQPGRQVGIGTRGEGRRVHGRRLRPRAGSARRLHVANGRRREYRRRPEGRLPVVQPGDRVHRRHVARDEVPPGLPGDPRLRHVRARHQVERRSRAP